ncbi:probable aspartic proteinase GIP2 [Arachis stenosperma]|uniref:probable aspartic proteinase GIP2 n=1 Tax=Arachis stenosperma TaxID=217475 RepID=UPI0025AD4E65|nr:probable aspartic proteinase GIP2 [Arachis stenosperma]
MAPHSSSSHVFLLSIALLSMSCFSLSPLILPIGKDPKTLLFYSQVSIGTPRHNMDLVIDLGGPIVWYDCNTHYNSSSYHPVSCDSKQCPSGSFCSGCNGPFKPGCSNNTCGANILNPFANAIFTGDTGEDALTIAGTKVSGLLTGCTDSQGFTGEPRVLQGLPPSAKGIIGLARTQLALPTQISSLFKLSRRFSLCLTSSNKYGLGNLYIGASPRSTVKNVDVSKIMQRTSIIVNPVSTAPISSEGEASYEYFIDVKSIKIGGKALNLKTPLLSIDKKGNGGTKLSTMDPFTKLHSTIYKPLVREFMKQASDKKMKKVQSIAPFEACYDFKSLGRTKTGFDAPTIDLVLGNGVQWTIYGGNSMVLVKKNVACLGVVDGGKNAMTAVVIGAHQLEENLLEFDLVSNKLGFSNSLHLHNAMCSQLRI